jgi:hypothetical protein
MIGINITFKGVVFLISLVDLSLSRFNLGLKLVRTILVKDLGLSSLTVFKQLLEEIITSSDCLNGDVGLRTLNIFNVDDVLHLGVLSFNVLDL